MTTSPFKDMDLGFDPLESAQTRRTTSAENALNDTQFNELYKAAGTLEPLYDLITEFTIIALGRLGFRRGELTHMKKDWVDFDNQFISIPGYQPCKDGQDGGICGDCKQKAKQMSEHNDVDVETAKQVYWKPKTARAVRDVPYSFSDRCVEVVEEYFDMFDEYYGAGSYVNRRVNDALEACEGDIPHTTPHNLRATAATHHAATGIDVYALQAFMGWAYAVTAEYYLDENSHRTKRVFERFHSLD